MRKTPEQFRNLWYLDGRSHVVGGYHRRRQEQGCSSHRCSWLHTTFCPRTLHCTIHPKTD